MTERTLRRWDLRITAFVVVASVVLHVLLPWPQKNGLTFVVSGFVLLRLLLSAVLRRRVRGTAGRDPVRVG